MRLMTAAAACSLLVAACAKQPEEPAAQGSGAKVAAPVATPRAPAEPAVARKEKVSNDLYEFEYFYPAAAAAIPELRRWLDGDLEQQRGELIQGAQQSLDESKKEGFPFNPFGYWAEWKVVADLPGWLSLSGSVSTFEGGAHPNHGFDALVWDKQRGVRREAGDLFTSEAALSRSIRRDFCRLLDKQRAEKRQGEDLGSPFTDCIDPADSTIILGSSNGRAFDRIGILVAPYEAGPYAEGEYEVTLPVTDAVLAVVRPEYRAAFAKAR